jgi:hypothetical protein
MQLRDGHRQDIFYSRDKGMSYRLCNVAGSVYSALVHAEQTLGQQCLTSAYVRQRDAAGWLRAAEPPEAAADDGPYTTAAAPSASPRGLGPVCLSDVNNDVGVAASAASCVSGNSSRQVHDQMLLFNFTYTLEITCAPREFCGVHNEASNVPQYTLWDRLLPPAISPGPVVPTYC